MKDSFALFFILFFLLIDGGLSLRNLKLGRDEVKYKALCKVAIQTVYQLFNRTIDFQNRYDAYIQQTDMMLVKVVVDEYASYPNYENQTTFQIKNGRPEIPDMLI